MNIVQISKQRIFQQYKIVQAIFIFFAISFKNRTLRSAHFNRAATIWSLRFSSYFLKERCCGYTDKTWLGHMGKSRWCTKCSAIKWQWKVTVGSTFICAITTPKCNFHLVVRDTASQIERWVTCLYKRWWGRRKVVVFTAIVKITATEHSPAITDRTRIA